MFYVAVYLSKSVVIAEWRMKNNVYFVSPSAGPGGHTMMLEDLEDWEKWWVSITL